MKRGVNKKVETTIERRVTYSYTREVLLKKLNLPDDAVLYVAGEIVPLDTDEVFQAAVTETK